MKIIVVALLGACFSLPIFSNGAVAQSGAASDSIQDQRSRTHSTHFFWAPNGYGLKKGAGYFQNNWILLNQVNYGFTDHFSLGVGTIPFLLFAPEGFPYWIVPKYSVAIKKGQLNLGAALMYFNGVGDEYDNGKDAAGFAYGIISTGSRDRNITLGFGYGYAEGEWTSYPAITISAMYRQSKKIYFLTENYLIPFGNDATLAIVSLGGRFMARKIAFDFGWFRPFGGDYDLGFPLGLPWIGFNVPFGKRK